MLRGACIGKNKNEWYVQAGPIGSNFVELLHCRCSKQVTITNYNELMMIIECLLVKIDDNKDLLVIILENYDMARHYWWSILEDYDTPLIGSIF